MEQEITQYICNKFNPAAILIHGSRAVGRAREHSDWDLILVFPIDSEVPKNGRVWWGEQNIEYSCHQLPIEETAIETEFGVKLQFGRVLYEEGVVGTELLQVAKAYYAQPLNWPAEQKESHKLWVQGRVDGMKDTFDSPLLFEKYAADFYSRITNYWYWAIHDSFSKPIYLALEEIAEKDSEYFALIEMFVTAANRVERVGAAEKILKRCFG